MLCSLVPNCFATLWTTACQALPVGSSQQGYWGGLPFRPPGDLLTRGLNLPLSHLLRCRWTLSLWASGEAFRCFCPAVELTSLSVACFSWFLRRLTLVSGHCFSGRGHLRPLERLHRILFPATGPEHALVFTSVLQSFSLALSDQHPIVYHFLRDLLPKTPPSLSRIPFVHGLSRSSAFQAGKKFHRILSHFLNSFPLISISWKLSVSITFQDIILFSHPNLCTLTSLCRLEARFILFIHTTFIYSYSANSGSQGRDSLGWVFGMREVLGSVELSRTLREDCCPSLYVCASTQKLSDPQALLFRGLHGRFCTGMLDWIMAVGD